ncbi:unnamed protein product [Prorocentrum cordatum]|uniref:Uncharacterized protein n=1 Tax=Prorocentrum cordatum TaxID=2364126 RepID=A0ABN9URW6_9DINO|nr:unnamed protein product [Polarella glacialis]
MAIVAVRETEEFEKAVSDPRCLVVNTAGPEPEVFEAGQAARAAASPFDVPKKTRVVVALVDPKKVALGQRYVKALRAVNGKVRINCVLELSRCKDPVGVDLFQRALLASGASQV